MITTAWFLSSWQQRLWAKQVTRKWAFSLLICLQTTNLPEYMSNVTVLKWKKSTFGWRASLLKIPILLDFIMKIKRLPQKAFPKLPKCTPYHPMVSTINSDEDGSVMYLKPRLALFCYVLSWFLLTIPPVSRSIKYAPWIAEFGRKKKKPTEMFKAD